MDFAHRGLHSRSERCPENSLAAIKRAVHRGYGVEIDVQRSADYEAVVFHDTTLNRMTDRMGPLANLSCGKLGEIALSETTETIPTLAQVLDIVAGRVPLLVEIKTTAGIPGVLEQRVANLLDAYDGPVATMSLNPNAMRWLSFLSPRLPRGDMLTKFHTARGIAKVLDVTKNLGKTLKVSSKNQSHFVACDVSIVQQSKAAEMRQEGKTMLAWTVTTADQAQITRAHADSLIFEGFTP